MATVRPGQLKRDDTSLQPTEPGRRRRRTLMWILLATGLIALPFLSLPGRYVFDTRDSAWFNPGTYLIRALALWRPNPYLGQEQHDGIMVPMGVVVYLLRTAGLSVWVTERIWHGLLLFTTAGTTILLVDALRGRRTVLAPLAAGLAYSLTPYTIGYGLPFTPVFLPYVLLPLLLLVTVKGAGRGGLLWPALFGVVTFLMGGGNGAPQIYVLLTAMALVAWLVLVERRVAPAVGLRFAGLSLAFFVGLNAYWLFLLSSPEVFNALKFSEQPAVINVTSSASEAVRGLGFWQFYGGDQFGPWVTTIRAYITFPALVVTGFILPIGALLSAWLVKWRYRLLFLFLGIVAVFVSVGGFPIGQSTPFGRLLFLAYDRVPGVAGLRTTYKVTAEVTIAVAVLFGIGLEALWVRVSRSRRPNLLRAAVLVSAVAAIAANAYPLVTGRLYNPIRSAPDVPTYWQDALGILDTRDNDHRAFFAPATYWTRYRWGSLKESVVATDPNLSALYPLRLPVAQRYGSNLVAALENPYLYGAPAEGTGQLLRYLGVRDVVLQNDVDWERSRTARPAQLQRLLEDPDIQPFMTFGAPGHNVTGEPSDDASADALERSLSPIQVLTVRDALPITNARPPDPIVVSGDGFGIAAAARAGLLEGDPAVLYSGNLTPPSLGDLLASSRSSFIVTDTNRRWAWSFSGPRSPHSYTLTQDDTLGGRTIGYLLFDDRPSTQSVAVYPGMRSITASAYGGAFGTSPQYRPSNAFDDDPATLWLVGTGGDPTGSWIQGTFEQRRLLSRLSIRQPTAWYLREIRNVSVEFSDGSSVVRTLRRGGETSISFPSRMAAWVRVRILSVGPNPVAGRRAGSAIADIQIPGLDPAEIVRVPDDLFQTAARTESGVAALARSPLTYLFQRVRGYNPQDPDEEVRIVRRFTAAGSASYELSGTVRLNPSAPDEQLDQVLFGNQSVQVSSSSRLLGNPALRGSSALDGDPSTSWVPRGAEGEWLTVRFPRHLVDTITVDTDRGPQWTVVTRVRAVLPDGTQATGDLVDPTEGTIQIDLPPTVTNRVSLFVDRVFSPLARSTNPVGINEVHIPGVAPLPGRGSSSLPCTFAGLTVDGRPIGVRPQGTVGDLVDEREVPLRACNNTLIRLNDGQHDLVAGGGLQPDTLMLTKQIPVEVPPATPTLPELSTVRHWDGSSDIRVTNAEGPFYLVLGQNYDRRWRASIDGHDLGPPTVVDGYSAGWRITRPGSFTVEVGYAQQRLYTYALGLTAVTLAVVAGVVAVSLVHRRRRRARRPDAS